MSASTSPPRGLPSTRGSATSLEPSREGLADLVMGAIRTAYFLRIPNVGDRVNTAVVEALTGRPVCHYAGHDESHLLAIGSVMAGAGPRSHVWGSGVMHPSLGIGAAEPGHIHALRGRLSLAALRDGGVEVGDVPLGDPGFLAPALLGIERSTTPEFRLGVVAHYADTSHPSLRKLVDDPDVFALDVHEPPATFLRKLARCAAVVSSSLHGLVFAEAMGIPNLWISVSDEVAGAGFKFRDWFSTMRRPQKAPVLLTEKHTAADLAAAAPLHDSEIVARDLERAFPLARLDELAWADDRRHLPVEACRARPTPVFFISFNRGGPLLRSIEAVRSLSTPTEIVVHDNGSTEAATLAVLDRLAADGVRVVRRGPISRPEELDQVGDTVADFFRSWAEPARYAVTDCDVDLSVARPDALAVYDELLNRFRKAACVGPMLRIRDIPPSYPLYNRVMNRHVDQFWRHVPQTARLSRGPVAVQEAKIDTTFALHRAGERFRRLKSGLRVYAPYEARHLDWYVEGADGFDSPYAVTSSGTIAHWNNAAELKRHAAEPLKPQVFHWVDADEAGQLRFHEQHTQRPDDSPAAAGPPSAALASAATKRAEAVERTEHLRSARQSDLARWRESGSHRPRWQERAVALAAMVRAGERVFEFGAGLSTLADLLPGNGRLTRSDLAPLRPDVGFYDLNGATLPAIHGHDVAYFSGVLEYVHDVARLAAFIANCFGAVVCSYATCASPDARTLRSRRASGWFNDLSEAAFVGTWTAAGFGLSERAVWLDQTLFRFDRR